jgi:hypothetical protein
MANVWICKLMPNTAENAIINARPIKSVRAVNVSPTVLLVLRPVVYPAVPIPKAVAMTHVSITIPITTTVANAEILVLAVKLAVRANARISNPTPITAAHVSELALAQNPSAAEVIVAQPIELGVKTPKDASTSMTTRTIVDAVAANAALCRVVAVANAVHGSLSGSAIDVVLSGGFIR